MRVYTVYTQPQVHFVEATFSFELIITGFLNCRSKMNLLKEFFFMKKYSLNFKEAFKTLIN